MMEFRKNQMIRVHEKIIYVFTSLMNFNFSIRVKVLFVFDKKFSTARGFKSRSWDKRNQVVSLVRNIFRDKTLKNSLGTVVNIIATKKVVKKTLRHKK